MNLNFELNCKGFESNLVRKEELCGGAQYIFRFANDYGASVVKYSGSNGHLSDLWELWVIKFGSISNDDWRMDFNTYLTDNVIGYLTDEDVRDYLRKIEEL